MIDRQQIFVGRFYWQTESGNFIDRVTSTLACRRCTS